ncbi:MAG: NTP transferase domain-containing protein [Acidobacteriaceae bacterium]|nr:NTP transferase domain-containing protein [Acidobacteriaceae bacterium]
MKIQKAVITAASPNQRTLPLQMLIDRDGHEKPVLRIIVDELRAADISEVCVVVSPGNQDPYARAAEDRAVRFVEQSEPLGYAHALNCARSFTKDDSFLHLVGDHLYVSSNGSSATRKLLDVAEEEECAVSAVQSTRESLLPLYGTVGGQRIAGKQHLYRIEKVVEKPTPTEAEQTLNISGLRSGYYLCFFGMHVLTPTVMEILARRLEPEPRRVSFSSVLNELAAREQYLAFQQNSRRYDIGVKYGLFRAQLALALAGKDSETVLAQLLELIALRETDHHTGQRV